jgi:hypothetical protein
MRRLALDKISWPDVARWAALGAAGGLLWRWARTPSIPSEEDLSIDATFGDAVVRAAQADLGVTEEGGDNRGVRIGQMQANTGNRAGDAWCASAASTWAFDAAVRQGVPRPIAGSGGVLPLVQQFQDRRNPRVGWLDVSVLRREPGLLRPGMLVMWTRSTYNSRLGHVGVVERILPSGSFVTLEGNSGALSDRVSREVHRLDSPKLAGAGFFREPEALGWTRDPPGVELFP